MVPGSPRAGSANNVKIPRACGPGRFNARVDHVPGHSVFDGLAAAFVKENNMTKVLSSAEITAGEGIAH